MIDILLAIQAIEDADEREYIGELFEKYSKKVKRLSLNILKNEQDADDAVGLTFLKIIKYREKFMGIEENQLKGRISLVTRCACFDFLDRRDKLTVVSMTEVVEDDEGNSNDMEIADDIDLLREMLTAESVERLHQAIRTLDSPAKEIVMLKYFDNMSNVSIADLLSMNASTVGTILQRSLKKLKKLLKEYHDDK